VSAVSPIWPERPPEPAPADRNASDSDGASEALPAGEAGWRAGAAADRAAAAGRRDAAALLAKLLQVDTSRRDSAGIRIALHPARPAPPPLYAACDTDELRALEYAVVDVETTGTAALRGHRVTEIAAIRVRGDGTVVDEYSTLVNPDRPIPPFITAITNISWEMVADAPRFAEIAPRLHEVLNGAVFVAHNAPFDWGFVSAEFGRLSGPPLAARTLCTVRMARRLVPEIPRRSLDALSMYFNVPNDARHRAYGDARATATIFGRLLERAGDRDIRSWAELELLLNKRKPRTRRRASPAPMPDA
jgi:DNA polymerase III subunit epsilon